MTRVIEFTEGNLSGIRAYVTYDDGEYMRVTPTEGHPLVSIEVRKALGGFQDVVECCNEVCGKTLLKSDCVMLGNVGPLCPECYEVVENLIMGEGGA